MGALLVTWPWRLWESLVLTPWRLAQPVDLVVFELNGPWVMEPWRDQLFRDLRFNYDPRSQWHYERFEGRFYERAITPDSKCSSRREAIVRRIRVVSQYENDFDPGDGFIVEQNLTPPVKAVLISASWTWSLDILVAWIVTVTAAVTARNRDLPVVVLVDETFVDPEHLLRPNNRISLSKLRREIVEMVPDVTDDLLVMTTSAKTAAWVLNDAFEFIYHTLSRGRVRWKRAPEFRLPDFVDRVKLHLM